MNRVRWLTKYGLGLLCYWYILAFPWPSQSSRNHLFMWALSWAGFYAHDSGFADWKRRCSSGALTEK